MKHLLWKVLALLHLEATAVSTQRKLINAIRFCREQVPWLVRPASRVAIDGLPTPPPKLAFLVTGYHDLEYFYKSGLMGAESIREILAGKSLDINGAEFTLDFGYGCGRITRHWKTLTGPDLPGTDYNPRLIERCLLSLPFAQFNTDELASRLRYADGQFHFVYAISGFTHPSEGLQHFWIAEPTRMLEPGGFLLITVQRSGRFFQLTPAEIQRFESGQVVVRREGKEGTNACSAYHPEQYVRQKLARELTVVDLVPGGAKDGNQDMVLLQKQSSMSRASAHQDSRPE